MKHFTFHCDEDLFSWDEIFEMQYIGFTNINKFGHLPKSDMPNAVYLMEAKPESSKFSDEEIEEIEKKYKTNIIDVPYFTEFRDEYDIIEDQIEITTNINNRISKSIERLNLFEYSNEKLKQQWFIDVAFYHSFHPSASSHGIHRDAADVFHWQQQGLTEFTVYENGAHTYLLAPGDGIFIPFGMYHDTKPITPRCGLSIGYFHDDYNDFENDVTKFYDKRGYHHVYSYDNPFDSNYDYKETQLEVSDKNIDSDRVESLIQYMNEYEDNRYIL